MELPYKTKIRISGCNNSCTSAYSKDIGILVDDYGKFFITIGGCAGLNPKAPYTLATGLNEKEAFLLVKNILNYYKDHVQTNEKFRNFIDRINFEKLQENIFSKQFGL